MHCPITGQSCAVGRSSGFPRILILAAALTLAHAGAGPDLAHAAGGAVPAGPASTDAVTLSDSQLSSIAVATVEPHEFPSETEAVGSIDFNEDMSVQVFAPYQGRIIQAFRNLGDDVKKGQVLFTIESPDFIAAQSSLISAAASLDQTTSALMRAKKLYAVKGIDQNDYETAIANQASAEGALRAARHAIAIFGRSEAEIDHIVASRQVESALVVKSPISGRVTARNAAPGLFEQPGTAPAPYSVADLSTVWMLANVPESEIAEFKVGQPVFVSVAALPSRAFSGTITALGATVDANSRRLTLRSVVKDPKHELLPNMFATFVIRTGPPALAPAVPVNGVVREGDGTMSVWVVGSDPHRFVRHPVKIGKQHAGYDEILDGVKAGDRVAVDGAIFLSNILYGGAS
jgi:cobalt-zinc-cadmium efflux system membrane fusion protein